MRYSDGDGGNDSPVPFFFFFNGAKKACHHVLENKRSRGSPLFSTGS